MQFVRIPALLLLFSLIPVPAFAFSPEGHEVVAHIAARMLGPHARAAVGRLLGGDAETMMVLDASWADEVRKVAKATGTPLVDLNADSAALIQRMGAAKATTLAMTAPLPAELAAAEAGTTLPPRPKEEARLPDMPTTPGGPQGQIMRKFDYTHLGDTGARTIARLVADDLARAIPALRSQLLP